MTEPDWEDVHRIACELLKNYYVESDVIKLSDELYDIAARHRD
jgi:hypothetical protein